MIHAPALETRRLVSATPTTHGVAKLAGPVAVDAVQVVVLWRMSKRLLELHRAHRVAQQVPIEPRRQDKRPQFAANMGSLQGNSLVTRNPGNDNVQRILATNQNIAGTKTQGFDVDARYRFSLGEIGDFTAQINASKVNNFVRDAVGDGNFTRLNGTFDPEYRANASLNWSRGDFTGTIIGNVVSSTSNGAGSRLGSWVTWDLQFGWSTPWDGAVTIGARNLFDEDPPLSFNLDSPYYSNQLHDIFGRVPFIRYQQDL